MTERDALIALNGIEELSNRRILRLREVFGSAAAVWRASEAELRSRGGLSSAAAIALKAFSWEKFLENEYNVINNNTIIITISEESYPERLREISDAPVVLYVYGAGIADLGPAVGIVGSRQASVYGRNTAAKMASRLAEHGVSVVSGLARGIDTAAHEGCLRAAGRTVAVLGCGLGVNYPRENADLRDRIAEGGAVVSEFPWHTPPRPYHFPRRNRIVSGLSAGVIVVEAAAKSGALITADFALEQGRDVYAVPAMIDHPNAAGTHSLIRQGAQLITSADDVLDDLGVATPGRDPRGQARRNAASPAGLTEAEGLLFKHISDQPVHIDDLVRSARIDLPAATGLLLSMEIKNLITQLPGKRFKR